MRAQRISEQPEGAALLLNFGPPQPTTRGMTDLDASRLSASELDRLLETLETEERDISKRRRRLHDRIDSLRANGGSGDGSAELLASLELQEREISDARRRLHERIDELRAARYQGV